MRGDRVAVKMVFSGNFGALIVKKKRKKDEVEYIILYNYLLTIRLYVYYM